MKDRTAEEIEKQKEVTWSAIKDLNNEILEINSRINELNDRKKSLRIRISKRRKYINLLEKDLEKNQ